jgi:dienelactone hydrolase
MRLTMFLALGASAALLAACGGSTQPPSSAPGQAPSTSTAIAPPEERAQLFAYEQSEPLRLKVGKTTREGGAEVEDVRFEAAGRSVAAYLVRPAGKPKAAVLWAHWYGEEPNTNRTEFLPDAAALAKAGVVSLLPQGTFPWKEKPTGDVERDRQLAVDQVIQLRRGLDVLQEEAGDVPIGFVGHDYGAMFGSLLAADGRPRAYVLMAPDATFANWFVKYFVRGASLSEYQQAFAPLDPVSYVGEAAPATVFLQFAESDPYVPGYIADRLTEAAGDAAQVEAYGGGHELDDAARKDRLTWLRRELGLP